MNIKTLRRNYKDLNEIERNSLFISALIRNDKSEKNAVLSASPKVLWEKVDFAVLYERVLTLQMIVIIEKADYWHTFSVFLEFESPKHKGIENLSLYFFFTLTDAWKVVCKEIGIDARKFEEMLFPNNFLLFRLTNFEDSFREFAFTETEAQEFLKKRYKLFGEKLVFTLENRIAEFRKFLNLPEK